MTRAPVSEESAILVQALVLYSLAEVQAGHATRIEVEAHDHSFAVADDGRGHSIDKRIEGSPYLSFIYEHFSFPFGVQSPGSVQLQGIGMSLVNRLCSYLSVMVTRSGTTLTLTFQAGTLISQVRESSYAAGSGTRISGTASRVAPASQDRGERLWCWLSNLLPCQPGLSISYNGEPVPPPQSGV